MALTFASGQYVNAGSAASLDNLATIGQAFTVWAWVYRTSNGGNQHIVTKDGSFPSGWAFVCDNGTAEGETRLVIFRGTLDTDWTDAISTSGQIPLNTWAFVAGTYSSTGGGVGTAKLFIGAETTNAVEPSYVRQQAGATGAPSSDAAYNLYVGNLSRATTLPFLGRIQRSGVITRALTLAEIEAIRAGTLAQQNVSGTVLLYDLSGTGTQTDLSGNGNDGTVVGATDSAGPTLPVGQFARPASTTSAGLWTPVGAATLHEATDETTVSDADYAQSDVSPVSASAVRVAVGTLTDPTSSTGHVVRYRMGKDAAGGDTLTVTPRLYQGVTLISTGPAQAVPDSFTTYSWTLTGAEADAVSNYADLRVDISAITT